MLKQYVCKEHLERSKNKKMKIVAIFTASPSVSVVLKFEALFYFYCELLQFVGFLSALKFNGTVERLSELGVRHC